MTWIDAVVIGMVLLTVVTIQWIDQNKGAK